MDPAAVRRRDLLDRDATRLRLRFAGPVSLCLTALLVGSALYAGFRELGSHELRLAREREPTVRSRLGSLDELALAAAMPGSRYGALSALEDELTLHFEHTRARVQLRIELDALNGVCPTYWLSQQGWLDDALAAARAAGRAATSRRSSRVSDASLRLRTSSTKGSIRSPSRSRSQRAGGKTPHVGSINVRTASNAAAATRGTSPPS